MEPLRNFKEKIRERSWCLMYGLLVDEVLFLVSSSIVQQFGYTPVNPTSRNSSWCRTSLLASYWVFENMITSQKVSDL